MEAVKGFKMKTNVFRNADNIGALLTLVIGLILWACGIIGIAIVLLWAQQLINAWL